MMVVALILVGAISMIVIGCCVVTAYAAVDDNPFLTHSCFDGDRAALQRFARFTYPESAARIHEDCVIWQGSDIWIWFEMDPADMNAFIESTEIEAPLSPATLMPSQGPTLDEDSTLYGKWHEMPYYQELWIDTSDPDHLIVILRFSEI